MSFTFSCIHQFERSSAQAAITLRSSSIGAEATPVQEFLMGELKATFHTSSKKRFGFFDPDNTDSQLQALVKQYHENTLDLNALNDCITEQFKHHFTQLDEPFQWHLWIAIEEHAPQVIYLFLMEIGESYHLTPDLTIAARTSIQPDKLRFGLKIDLTEAFEEHTKTYLTYLSPKTGPLANAFGAFTGFNDGLDRKEQTVEFFNVVEEYANTLPEEQGKTCREQIIDYCREQDRFGAPVEPKVLSEKLDESRPNAFMDYYADSMSEPPKEIYTDRQQLRAYTRFYGRTKGCSISFDTTMFGSDITYNDSTESLTIRALPASLKTQIRKHKEKMEN